MVSVTRPVPPMVRAIEREARVFARLWKGVVFSTFVQPILFLGAMGLGLGDLVDDGPGAQDLGAPDYLQFVTPGLLIAGGMISAAGESLWPVLGGMKWRGQFHALVRSPLGPGDAYGGYVTFLAIRSSAAAVVFLLVAAALGGIASPLAVLAVPVAGLSTLSFAAPITAWSAGCETDRSFSLVMRLGVVPLFLFSGTFFPVEQLPIALEWLAWLSPLWHGVDLARGFTTGEVDWILSIVHVIALAAVVAVAWRWGTRRFARRLTP